jgi:hypothetical protein
MVPPKYHDVKLWVDFRRLINTKMRLKAIVTHFYFELAVSFLIILSFINSIFYIYQPTELVVKFDTSFIVIFVF